MNKYAMSSSMISSKKDPKETVFQNYSLVEAKVRVWLKDEELPALSKLTIKENLKNIFKNMEIVEDTFLNMVSFEIKYMFVNQNNICFVYESSEKMYIKTDKETIFEEANIVNISDNLYVEFENNLYKLYKASHEKYVELYTEYVSKKHFDYEPEEMYVSHGKKDPLTNPPA